MTQAYPSVDNRFDEFTENVPASDVSELDADGIVYISDDLRKYNYHLITAIGQGHLHVEVTLDGRFWYPAAVSLIDDVTTNSKTLNIPAGSMGVLQGKFKQLRVGSFGQVNLAGVHGWV